MPVVGVGPSKLFVADSPHMAVGSLANPNPSVGTLTVDRVITGNLYANLSNNIGSLALDPAHDFLYVGNGTSIRVFSMASTDSGDVIVARVITNSPSSGNTGSMALDTTNNRLFVGDDTFGVREFDNATAINGATSSTRVITGLGTVHGVAVDPGIGRDILYVSNTTTGSTINLFTASAAKDPATPLSTVMPTVAASNHAVGGISVDTTNDVLYVAGLVDGIVMVFNGAHALSTGTPSKTLTFPNNISSVTIDPANDRLYAVSSGAIYILNGVSTASDPISVTAVAAPAGGNFTALAINP